MRLADHVPSQVAADYTACVPNAVIATRYGLHYKSVARIARRGGAVIRSCGTHRKYSLNEEAFARLTDAAAYWLGFLLADGGIDTLHNQLVVGLASRDSEHLELLRSFLGSNRPVHFYHDGKAAVFCARSRRLLSDLSDYGITPRKTFTAAVDPRLADSPHFWRGMIDADGCLWWTKIKNNPPRPGLNLYGTSSVCESFARFVSARFPALPVRAEPHKSIFVTRFTGIRVAKLIEEIYASEPALPRKRELARAFVQCYIDHPPRAWILRHIAR